MFARPLSRLNTLCPRAKNSHRASAPRSPAIRISSPSGRDSRAATPTPGRSKRGLIYVLRDAHGLGLGRALYEALEACLREQGFTNVNACIACPVVADEYLTRNSIEFHAHMGYRLVGEFSQCACKFGRWYDMAWMEKLLLPHTPNPEMPRSFDDVREIVREKYGIA